MAKKKFDFMKMIHSPAKSGKKGIGPSKKLADEMINKASKKK